MLDEICWLFSIAEITATPTDPEGDWQSAADVLDMVDATEAMPSKVKVTAGIMFTPTTVTIVFPVDGPAAGRMKEISIQSYTIIH